MVKATKFTAHEQYHVSKRNKGIDGQIADVITADVISDVISC